MSRTEEIIKAKWEEIEKKFSITPDKTDQVLKARWRNLRTARDRRIAQNEKTLLSGAAREDSHDYQYEENMQFLKNIELSRRTTTSNIPDSRLTKRNFNESMVYEKPDHDIDPLESGANDHIKNLDHSEKSCKSYAKFSALFY